MHELEQSSADPAHETDGTIVLFRCVCQCCQEVRRQVVARLKSPHILIWLAFGNHAPCCGRSSILLLVARLVRSVWPAGFDDRCIQPHSIRWNLSEIWIGPHKVDDEPNIVTRTKCIP